MYLKNVLKQIKLSSNNKSIKYEEIQSIFEELSLETFEKRNKFLQFEQKEDTDNNGQYLSTTTVTTSIN